MWPLEVPTVPRILRSSFVRDCCGAIAERMAMRRAVGKSDPCRKILVINGHPDPRPDRFCAALCAAYATGARSQGWETHELRTGGLTLSNTDSNPGESPADIVDAIQAVRWANQLIIVFPLWLDRPPPALSRLFDQVAQVNAASPPAPGKRRATPARIVVTMGMPAFAHRAKWREGASDAAHSLSLKDVPAGEPTFIGSVDAISAKQRMGWLHVLHASGLRGY
jgi:putative NADPH-quinone reductase